MKMGKTLRKILGVCVISTIPFVGQFSAVLATETSTDSEAWKSNVGTIELGNNITYTGKGISISNNVITITQGGDFTVTGTLSNGMIEVNTEEKVKIRLNNANIRNNNGPAICFTNAKKAFITLEAGSENYLEDGSSYNNEDAKGALFSNDSLEIKGKGTLNIVGNYKHGIVSDDDIVIENGEINVTSNAKDGIHANDNITVDGGTLNIVSKVDDGVNCEGDIIINGGIINVNSADDAIHADLELTVNGGTINVENSGEGLESKTTLTINDGTITVSGKDDNYNAGSSLIINGGTSYCYSSGNDSIDSNGTLTINGGTTIAIGSRSPECGFDCDSNNFSINGGTVIGLGGETSGPTASSCTQASAILGGYTANSLLHIQNSNGDDILTYKIPVSYNTMLFSTPKLLAGATYTIYTGGTVSGGTEFHGVYADGNYSGGSQSTSFTVNSMVTQIGGSIFGAGRMNQGGMNHGESHGGMKPGMRH